MRQSYGRHAHVAGTRKKLTNVKFFWGDKALNCRNLCFTPVGSAHAAKLRSSCPCGVGVAHSLGKGEVTSSNLVMGNLLKNRYSVILNNEPDCLK